MARGYFITFEGGEGSDADPCGVGEALLRGVAGADDRDRTLVAGAQLTADEQQRGAAL